MTVSVDIEEELLREFDQAVRAHYITRNTELDSPCQSPDKEIEGNASMKRKQDIEVIHGSGNVFRDLKRPDADVKQLKGILAAEIIKMLDRDRLTVRAAQTRTGITAADFSRIRNANLARFTVDRLMAIINRLGSSVEVTVKVRRSTPRSEHATA